MQVKSYLLGALLLAGCEPEQPADLSSTGYSTLQILVEGACVCDYEIWQGDDLRHTGYTDCEQAKYVYEQLKPGLYEIRFKPYLRNIEKRVTITKKPMFQELHVIF